MIRFFSAHKRVSVIIFSWVALCAFVLIPNWREGPFYFLFFSTLFVTLIASQLFWIPRVVGLGERFIHGRRWRVCVRVILGVLYLYLFFFAYNFSPWNTPQGDSTHLTLRSALFVGAWSVWLVGSWVGFGLVMVFWTADRTTRAVAWVYRKARKASAGHAAAPLPNVTALDPTSPARRRLLEQTAVAVSAVPFVAAAYGLLYGRLDVEVTRPRIALARLPKPLRGFASPSFPTFTSAPS